MRDEANVGLRCLTARSSHTTKGVGSYVLIWKQDDGHGSRNPVRSVCNNIIITTYLPNGLAPPASGADRGGSNIQMRTLKAEVDKGVM